MLPARQFRRLKGLRLGYEPGEVDEVADRIEASLRDQEYPPKVTVTQLHHQLFPLRAGGYDLWDVDRYLEQAIAALANHPCADPAESERARQLPATASHADAQELTGVVQLPAHRRFVRAPLWGLGYDMRQVDAFVDKAAKQFHTWLTSEQARMVTFAPQWRGYDESDVDMWLDHVQLHLSALGR
jgi:DivIVA domain-containing protein